MQLFPLIAALAVALTAGCTHTAPKPGVQGVATLTADAGDSYEERARQVLGGNAARSEGLDKDLLYKFLLAEIAGQRGNPQLAAQAYLELARQTRDPRIARRATEIALYAKLDTLALESARIWLKAEENSPVARQTLATLLVSARELDAARPIVEELLAATPKEEIGQALLHFQGALSRHPDKPAAQRFVVDLTKPYLAHPEAYFVRAQAAAAAEQYDVSLAEIKRALKARPDWEAAALLQSQLLARDNRGAGLDYLRRYLDDFPGAQDVRLNYARALIAERRYPEARTQFAKLLEANAGNADLAFTVALLSIQMNDLDAADRQLRQALALGYKDADAVRFQIAQVNEELKRFEEAARWYRTITGGDQFVVAQARYAVMLARQGQVDIALEHLRGLQPREEAQRVQLIQAEAQLLREVREYQRSYEVLRLALDNEPDHPELLYDVALAAEKVDRLDVAEQSLRRLIPLQPDHAQAYHALGSTPTDRTDRLSEAREYIVKALTLAPDDPFILDSMGWVEFRLGNIAEGLEYLRRAYDQRKDPEIAAHLGEALWVKGRQDEARRIWKESLQANPDSEPLQNVIRKYLK